MRESFKGKLVKNLFTSKGFLFILIIATIWVVLICLKITNKSYQMAKEISSVQQEIERLKKDNQDLTAIMNSYNNPSFLEKEAKRRLNLRKQGEEVVILPKDEFFNNQTTTLETNQEKPSGNNSQNQSVSLENNGQNGNNKEESNSTKWWRYFFH